MFPIINKRRLFVETVLQVHGNTIPAMTVENRTFHAYGSLSGTGHSLAKGVVGLLDNWQWRDVKH